MADTASSCHSWVRLSLAPALIPTSCSLSALLGTQVLLDAVRVFGRVGWAVRLAPALSGKLAKHLEDGHSRHLLTLELLGYRMPEHQVLESAENVGAPDEDDSLLFEFPDRQKNSSQPISYR